MLKNYLEFRRTFNIYSVDKNLCRNTLNNYLVTFLTNRIILEEKSSHQLFR